MTEQIPPTENDEPVAAEPIAGEAPAGVEVPEGGVVAQTITLRQPILGMDPYLLVEAKVVPEDERDDEDPEDDGFRLHVTMGGGAEDGKGYELAALVLFAVPAEDNPMTAALAQIIRAHPDAEEALRAYARFVGFPEPS